MKNNPAIWVLVALVGVLVAGGVYMLGKSTTTPKTKSNEKSKDTGDYVGDLVGALWDEYVPSGKN